VVGCITYYQYSMSLQHMFSSDFKINGCLRKYYKLYISIAQALHHYYVTCYANVSDQPISSHNNDIIEQQYNNRSLRDNTLSCTVYAK
jgi:hypothetical protein